MESDDLSSFKTSEVKLGLEKDLFQSSLKPRAKRMEGEEKSGAKDRSKPTEISLISDDDEPIGSLFKLKRPRNPKKVKLVVEKSEVREEKLVAQDEDFGSMDDTLASFRKRLKGPKKDTGSVNPKLLKKYADKGGSEGGGVADLVVNKGVVENKRKEKVKKTKMDAKRERIRGDSLEDQNEEGYLCGESSSQSKDEKMEDKLSCIFQKVQSGSRKSRLNSFMKQNSSFQSLGDSLNPVSEDVLECSKSASEMVHRTDCATNGVCKDLKTVDGCASVTGLSSSVAVSEHSKVVKHQRLDNGFGQDSNMEGDSDENMKSRCKRHARSLEMISSPTIFVHSGSDERLPDVNVSSFKEGFLLDPCSSIRHCEYTSHQGDNLETHSLKNGLKIFSMDHTGKEPTSLEDVDGLSKCKSNKDLNGVCDQQSKRISAICISDPGNEISSPPSGELALTKSYKSSSKRIGEQAYDIILDDSRKTSSSNAYQHLKMDKTDNDSDFNQCLKSAMHAQSHLPDSGIVSPKFEETCGDCDATTSCPASVCLKKETSTKDGSFLMNHQGNSLKSFSHPNKISNSIQNCNPVLRQSIPSVDVMKGTSATSHDCLSINEETDAASPPSEENESYAEDAVSIPDSELKDDKSSSAQRGARKPKKRRLGDMAYEGDPDWEILANDSHYLESDQVVDSDRSFRTREKSDSSSISVTEAENGGAAAVSVGLKAHAAGPVEKIKFKEVLKRRGGLQEYLECRNHILALWSKDVSRILPLADCGVTDTPTEDESTRASLIREIYAFLDQGGYINVGIALEKEKSDPGLKHNYKLLEEKTFEVNPGVSVADLEDGVSFILGQVKSSETCLEANNATTGDENPPPSKATKSGEINIPVKHEGSNVTEGIASDIDRTGSITAKLCNGLVNSNDLNADPFSVAMDSGADITNSEFRNELQSVQSSSCDDTGGSHTFQCDSDGRKKIIVIGAGPAGLTAARHLQRQGFSVSVLEARSRIGGRVFTDRTSLSVPVDLGASIITGVEADVATERRSDPSSLICAQLGLELTVLNSDCPLYDIVTREKVPADLDEALEAEYNSLLDDMVLVVAQKGEHAMRMSLEEGLEYALKTRRMTQSRTDIDESEMQDVVDNLYVSKSCSVEGIPEKSLEKEEILSPLERRVMDWHFAHLEYGCAALLKDVSLPYWNQDDVYGGFGGAHCMIKGGYSNVVESLSKGLRLHLNHVVTDISYSTKESGLSESLCNKVKVSTSNGNVFFGDAVLVTLPLGCLKAETIKFSPPLPQWKRSSIQRLGFGVLNKVILEFPEVFWDDSVDYFGATAEETDRRGHCFMFWNVRKTVGAPVLISLVVGKAAIDGQHMSSSYHVSHALMVLRKLFGEAVVPDPVASVVTDWGMDPFSYGAYSYVAIGSSGEDYDILGRPVENCLFFAGEATCKEHPDTVGGAMMSGLREAVRIIDIFNAGNDYTAEVEAMEAAQRQSECERDEVRDITKRLEAVELSNVLYKNSLDGAQILTREAILKEMFFSAKTTAGRLRLAKKLLNLPVEILKSFAGTRKGLTTLNSWILDSMGKDGTQLLRHCVRLLVRVSTDLLAVRLSGIGKTVKEKVCVHTSRDIRAIASQLVSVWLEVFRREKALNGGLKLLRQSTAVDSSKKKSVSNPAAGKPPLHTCHGGLETKGSLEGAPSSGSHLPSNVSIKKVNGKLIKLETSKDLKLDSHASLGRQHIELEEESKYAMTEEELAALAAAEAAHAAARAAAEAYASTEAKSNAMLQLPKIPSFHKFARREQYAQMDEYDVRRKWSGGILGRQDCISEIDSRNCRVRDWSVDFSATCNLDNSRISVDNLSQRSHSNVIACHMNYSEQSGETTAVDSSLFTRAWVDTAGSEGIKDYHAIERWQSQAAAADSDFFHPDMHIKDEEDSNTSSKPLTWKNDGRANEGSISQVTLNKEAQRGHSRGADRIKQAVVDFVASLLMPVYKARKIDREGYKSIMKKTATKVMELATDAEKGMSVPQFLDFKRKNKIRAFVDKLIERHMAMKPPAARP